MSEYPQLCCECSEIGEQYDTKVRDGDVIVMLECPLCGRCWSVSYIVPGATVYRDTEEQ
jgi:hypothetical protein